MGLLGKLLGRDEEQQPEEQQRQATYEAECPHKALTARWDRPEDIGKEDLATSFHCEGCGQTFSGDEGRELLHSRMAPLT